MGTKGIKNILECNQERIKIVNGGLKVLSRSDCSYTDCDFRLAQDGMSVMENYLVLRRVDIGAEDFAVLVTNENPYMTKMSQLVQDTLAEMKMGPIYYVYTPDGSSKGPKCKVSLAGWRGKTSCRLFLPRFDRHHYMRMLGLENEIRNKGGRQVDDGDMTEEATEVKEQCDDTAADDGDHSDAVSPETIEPAGVVHKEESDSSEPPPETDVDPKTVK